MDLSRATLACFALVASWLVASQTAALAQGVTEREFAFPAEDQKSLLVYRCKTAGSARDAFDRAQAADVATQTYLKEFALRLADELIAVSRKQASAFELPARIQALKVERAAQIDTIEIEYGCRYVADRKIGNG